MEISLIQAILIGCCAYMGTLMTPWFLGCTGSWYVVGRPLVSGMLIGIILGDVSTGIIVGAAVQAVFIAMVTPGGAMSTDLNSAAFIGVGLGVVSVSSGATVEAAVAIATAAGAVGVILHNLLCVFNAVFNQACLSAVEKGDQKKFFRNHWVWPQIALFVARAVPTVLVLYYGQHIATQIIEMFPTDSYLMSTLSVLGGILPALGVAILIKNLVKVNLDLIPVLLGFTLVAAVGLNMISLAIVAAYLAYSSYNSKGSVVATASADDFGLEEEL